MGLHSRLVMAMALFAASCLAGSDAIDSCWLNEGSVAD